MVNSKLIKIFWPFLFIIIAWIIFSFPYFFQNKVPYSSTYQVNFFPPWSSYEKFHGPVKNNAMPDVATQIFPWKKLTIETYKNGQVPLWNPYNFSGNPHLANNQSAAISPFNFLFFILPFVDAWSILILLQPLLAGLFMYMMLRSLGRSKEASAAGGVVFMFCGFLVVWMAYGTLSYAILFLPLSIYSVQQFIKTNGRRYLLILGLTVPLSFFSGHFQTSLYFLFATLAFTAYKLFQEKKGYILLGAIFLGITLSLPQILPSFELYQNSLRSSSFIKSETVPFQYLSTIFAPDFFGNPVTRNDWLGYYAERASFIGIIPFILIFLGLLKRNKEVLFFTILGAFSIILSLDSPLTSIIVSLKIPVVSTSSFSRIIILFSFCLATICAFGFDNFFEFLRKKTFPKLYERLALSLLAVFFLITLSIFINFTQDKILIALKSLRIPFFLLILFFLGFFIQVRFKKTNFLPYLIMILITSQSLFFASKWMPFDPKDLVFPRLSVIDSIKENIGYGRLFGNFGAEVSSFYGISSIEGYDPLYIERYGEFIQSADFGDFRNALRSVVKLSRRGDSMNRAIDFLGVNLIYHPSADTNQNWAFPVWEEKSRFVKIFDDNIIQIFRNNTAMNRVSLFYDYEIINNKEKIIKKFYSKDFDFRNTLILEEDPKSSEFKVQNSKLRKGGKSEIASYTPNEVKIRVQTESPALLFLSDNYYPGWKAYLNGVPTKIFRADYAFRAIVVPAGGSEVLFKFEPVF